MAQNYIAISVMLILLAGQTLGAPWWRKFWPSETASYTYPAEKANSCKKHECPEYRVISSSPSNDYELRRYEPSVWVATTSTVAPQSFWSVKRNMFWDLFGYISGGNSQDVKIKMTAPVLRNVSRACDSCERKMTMYFMIPAKHKANPPTPTNREVSIVNMPAMNVYVRYFGGRPTEKTKMEHLSTLENALKRDAKTYESSYFIQAGYDSPWTFRKRRNEIWLVAGQ